MQAFSWKKCISQKKNRKQEDQLDDGSIQSPDIRWSSRPKTYVNLGSGLIFQTNDPKPQEFSLPNDMKLG